MKPFYLFIIIISLASCSQGERQPDAWGNFEATEILISSESTGRILSMNVNEGDLIKKGELAALVDTTMIFLQLRELNAGRSGIYAKINSIEAQNRILQQQITNLQVNIGRVENMLEANAATQKQLDDLTGQVDVLNRQIDANKTQKASVMNEIEVLGAKEGILKEQLSRCYVRIPSDGTVLVKYSEEGEITAPGRPLIKIADLSIVKLKVFVSGSQLAFAKIGESCTVKIDNGKESFREYTGKITRVSDKAEFTPKIIQTREERVDLVYAITIEVPNDGSIKAGMPGEATFRKEE